MKFRFAALSMALVACTTHVASSIQVDGRSFSPRTCRSGQALGFSGVELVDQPGQRLRLARLLDGTFQVVYFPAGSETGETLGACGTMTLEEEGAVINGIRDVEGSATLACGGSKHKVTGALRFQGCH